MRALLVGVATGCIVLLVLLSAGDRVNDESSGSALALEFADDAVSAEAQPSVPCDREECRPKVRFTCSAERKGGEWITGCDASSSSAGCGWITSYEWRFEDGSGGRGVEAAHVCETWSMAPGIIELTVRNSYGCTDHAVAVVDYYFGQEAAMAPFYGLPLIGLLVAVIWLLMAD